MASFTDTFTRADNTDLGADYSPMTGSVRLDLVGNAVRASSTVQECFERYSGITPGAGQYVEATLKSFSVVTSVIYFWASVRCVSGANTAYNFVVNTNDTIIQKRVSGGNTQLETVGAMWVPTDVLRGEIDSSSFMEVYQNAGSLLTHTDSTIPAGQVGLGIYCEDSGSANDEIETFSGGDWPEIVETTPESNSTFILRWVQPPMVWR